MQALAAVRRNSALHTGYALVLDNVFAGHYPLLNSSKISSRVPVQT